MKTEKQIKDEIRDVEALIKSAPLPATIRENVTRALAQFEYEIILATLKWVLK